MGFVIYGHRGSGDHSCEDRLRGTCRLLPEPPDVYSACPEEDWHYGIGKLGGLCRHTSDGLKQDLQPGDFLLADGTGEPERLCKRGVRQILWGWTPKETTLSKKTIRKLSGYAIITVMDRHSLEMLRHAGLGTKVRMGPDPSFLVDKQIRPLRGAFRKDTVGLCLGAACSRYEDAEGILYRSYCALIRYILEETPFQIALIPYCSKRDCRDELLLALLERQFRDSGRIFLRGDGGCRCLRGDLSLCRCVIGASGAVAAWSCGVPALCLGTNGRSVGLAGELFGSWQRNVVSIQSLRSEQDLINRFRIFLCREDAQRQALERMIPERRQQAQSWSWTEMRLFPS